MKRFILAICFLLVSGPGWAAYPNYTICPSGCDYTAVQSAVSDIVSSHTTLDSNVVIVISGEWSSPDTTNIVVSGITEGSYSITIKTTGSAFHDGIMPDGSSNKGYVLRPASGDAITVTDGHVVIDGLAIDASTSGGDAVTQATTDYVSNMTVKNCIIKGKLNSSMFGVDFRDARGNNYVFNNVFYNFTVEYGTAVNPNNGGDGSTVWYIYGNTIYNMYGGIDANVSKGNGASIYVSNNIISATSNYSIGTTGDINGGSNNICDRADQCSAGTLTSGQNSKTDYANYYVSTAAENFNVKDSSAIQYDSGADLGSSYNVDIVGTARPQSTSWDVGAFEYLAGLTPSTRRIMVIDE